jgi:hypothetical protein
VKFVAGGSFASKWPDGSWFAPAPGSIVEVDDGDKAKVAYLQMMAAAGHGEIVEDEPEPEPQVTQPEPEVVKRGPGRPRKTVGSESD